MKTGISDKSKKRGYINNHHIIPKRFKTKSNKTMKLTLSEHAEVHNHIDGIKGLNSVLGLFIAWLKGSNSKN